MGRDKRIQHAIEYHVVRMAMSIAGRLSVRAMQRVGAALGSAAFDCVRVRRRVSVENIERALGVPEGEAVAIARRSYRNLGRSMLEFAALAYWSAGEVTERVDLQGIEHFEAALRGGRGAVFITGHYGSWEMMGARFATAGLPVDFLVGEQANARVDAVMNDLRRAHGVGIITRAMSIKKMARALQNNRIVCMLADQDARRSGIMVDFLGRPASTARGPALFSRRFGAPLLTGFIHRVGEGHEAIVEPGMDPPDQPEEEAILALTRHHADALARQIRRKPDEYFWPHRRWKTRSVSGTDTGA